MAAKRPDFKGIPTRRAKEDLIGFLAYVEENMAVSGPGIYVGRTPNGRPVSLTGGGGGSAPVYKPFQLIDVSDNNKKIRVKASTIDGKLPDGMSEGDDPPYIISGISGSGVVYVGISFDDNSGAITSRYIDWGPTMPPSTLTDKYAAIGGWAITGEGKMFLANYAFGPGNVNVCRNWFTTTAPFYTVAIFLS